MKKITIILVFIFSFNAFSQEKNNDNFFSFGLGYNAKFRFINLDEYEKMLKNNNMYGDKILLPLYSHNGELMTTIGFIPNLRMGINIGIGDTKSEKKISSIDTNFLLQTMVNYINLGIDLSYSFRIFKNFVILPNLEFGIGSFDINSSKYKSQSVNWNDMYNNNIYKISGNKISNDFYYIQPEINIEYALTNFTVFRFGVGYMYSISENWLLNDYNELINKPDNFNNNHLLLSAGIFIGIFKY